MVDVPDDLKDWLALLQAPQVGASTARRLADSFGGPRAVLHASDDDLQRAGVSASARRTLRSPDQQLIDASFEWLHGAPGRMAVTLGSDEYPRLLREIDDAPPVLFVCGNPALLHGPHLAIVGSRNPTRPGCETAYDFAGSLCRLDVGIVSGLAAGIDAAAHRGALAAGGVTIAVAAHGLDRVYPREHRKLAREIADSGALVSEFVPGTAPLREHFPRRNRIISGLSLGVLVVEAAMRSGSLITARMGAEQGREVFAVPGSIHNPMARGCHALIRQGAKLVETVGDLTEELGVSAAREATQVAIGAGARQDENEWDDDYVALLDAMGYDPACVDELVQRTGLTPQVLSSMLLNLELRGIVHPISGVGYVRAAKRE
ncbi:MAG: DNA processing protein [Gammaproteobacteria bacterium]